VAAGDDVRACNYAGVALVALVAALSALAYYSYGEGSFFSCQRSLVPALFTNVAPVDS
jgi:hypothetical protein